MAVLNLVGFWVIGTAVGASLCFGPEDLGVAGLWWGLALGLTATAIVGVACLRQTDFNDEARRASERTGNTSHAVALESKGKEEKDEEKGRGNPLDESAMGASL